MELKERVTHLEAQVVERNVPPQASSNESIVATLIYRHGNQAPNLLEANNY